ncbi:Succinate dehydrogenase assembly factor 2 mitochondrial, partial [Coemansia sp. RSA 1836]
MFLRLAPPRKLARFAPLAVVVRPLAARGLAGVGLERKEREGEDITTMRRRLQYQMRKRGILETDLLLSTFASEHLATLEPQELRDLDSLMSNIDWDIFYWATNKSPAPDS